MDELLTFKAVPDPHRAALVATCLRGRASSWWQQVKAIRQRQGKPRITSWVKFRKHLEREFLPYNYESILYQRLHTLRQNSRSVDAYTEEFYQLLSRIELRDSTAQLVSRYISGLKLTYQDMLNLLAPVSLFEAHQRAVLLELQAGRHTPPPLASSSRPTPGVPTVGPPSARSQPTHSTPNDRCFGCGELGHRRTSCPRACTTRTLLNDDATLLECVDDFQFDIEALPPLIEEHVTGDTGPLLVIQRACFTPRSADTNPQRSQIFESTCTINGKVCHFIIDSGSCENVMAVDTVAKLNLHSEPHPSPYTLA